MQLDTNRANTVLFKCFYGEGNVQFIAWASVKTGGETVDNHDIQKKPAPAATSFGLNNMPHTKVFFVFFYSLVGKVLVLDEYLVSTQRSVII